MIFWLLFIAAFLITMLVVVGIHEASHFAAAKLMGVKVLRFSIGFGKALCTYHDKSGTEYVFALIPLGGYVKMLGEEDTALSEEEKKQSYSAQPFYKKAVIIAAGPLSNFICALLLYTIIYSLGFTTVKPILGNITPQSIADKARLLPQQEITQVGGVNTPTWTKVIFQLVLHTGDRDALSVQTKTVCGLTTNKNRSACQEKVMQHQLDLSNWTLTGLKPDPLKTLGIEPYFPTIPLIIGNITPHSAAAKAGFALNDHLKKINHQPITSWEQLAKKIADAPAGQLTFDIMRQGKPLILRADLTTPSTKNPRLGIAPSPVTIPDAMLQTVRYALPEAMHQAYLQCKELTYFNIVLLRKMLTGQLSLDTLGGPIAIFDTAGQSLNQGVLSFLVFLAFMNLSIGFINLLPIPGLDGGHLFLQLIECIIRRPLPPMIMEWLLRVGFLLLFLVFLRALFNDFLRLF